MSFWNPFSLSLIASSGSGLRMGITQASSTYHAFFVGSTSLPGAAELWKTKAPGKVKFFFWLALHRRLWTAERRRRHGLQDHGECILCGQEPETASHLFLGCVFAREIWFKLLHPIGWVSIMPQQEEILADWWLRLPGEARPVFDSILLLACWNLWKERNNRTFRDSSSTAQDLFLAIVAEGELWVQAGFKSLNAACCTWSHFFPAL